MKKFRLAKVLEWKENLEKEARTRRFAAEEHAEALRHGAALARSLRESIPEHLENPEKPAPVQDLTDWSQFAERMRKREEKLVRDGEPIRPTLEEHVRAHVRLRQDVEGLRRLREKSHAWRRRLGARRAQETLDDAAARTKLPDPGSAFPVKPTEGGLAPSGENAVDRREPGSGSPSEGEGS